MAYSLVVSPEFKKDYNKLCRKNAAFRNAVDAKITQIVEVSENNPEHYKPLKAPLDGFKRVHVSESFILIFKILKEEKTIKLYRIEHHDKAYKK